MIDEMIFTYDTATDKNKCYPVLLLIDEAGRSAIPDLPGFSSTVVGRNLSLWIAIQSLSQLDAIYNRYHAETLRNNMDSQIYYRQASHDTAKDLEDSLGKKSDWAHSRTEYDGSESKGASEREVALLTAQAIKQLGDEEIIGFHHNLPPFQARRVDWRRFPMLRQRHRMTPPPLKELPQLAAGNPNTQQRRLTSIASWHLDPELFRWYKPRPSTTGSLNAAPEDQRSPIRSADKQMHDSAKMP